MLYVHLAFVIPDHKFALCLIIVFWDKWIINDCWQEDLYDYKNVNVNFGEYEASDKSRVISLVLQGLQRLIKQPS